MLGDYFEYGEYLPQRTITSLTYATIFTLNIPAVPVGTYLICANFIYQQDLFANNRVHFRYLVDGIEEMDTSYYGETDPGPGALDSRETAVDFFQVTFATETTHTIELQAQLADNTTYDAYTRDIRMTFYEEDTSRADYNTDLGTATSDTTTYITILSQAFTVPAGGANYSIWAKAGFTNPTDVKNSQMRVIIDATPIAELGAGIYNTSRGNTGVANCWGKNINCFFVDEGAHTLTLQGRRSGGSGIGLGVYWGHSSIRILRNE